MWSGITKNVLICQFQLYKKKRLLNLHPALVSFQQIKQKFSQSSQYQSMNQKTSKPHSPKATQNKTQLLLQVSPSSEMKHIKEEAETEQGCTTGRQLQQDVME